MQLVKYKRGDDTESSGDDHQPRTCTKVRQQVEQRRKERKQKEVQNWRVRLIRYRHMFDDDSLRQVVDEQRSLISRMTDCDGVSPMQGSLQVWCHGVS